MATLMDVLRILQETHVLLWIAIALLAFALISYLFGPRLRSKLYRVTFGDLAKEFPELENFVLRLLESSSDTMSLSSMMKLILVRRPSDRIRNLLAAYDLRVDETQLSVNSAEPAQTDHELIEDALKVLVHAALAIRSSQRTEARVQDTDVLIALFSMDASARALDRVGLSRFKVIYYLSHDRALAPGSDEIAPLTPISDDVWVRIHNDNFSPMDLVSQIMRDVFDLNAEDAVIAMQEVHRYGEKAIGPYTHELAQQKIRKAIEIARAAQAPLRLSLTSEAPTSRNRTIEPLAASDVKSRNPYAPPQSMVDRLDW